MRQVHYFKIIVVSILVIFTILELSQYYVSEKEDWKSTGEYLNGHASDGDSITVIGGLPEFVQLYASVNLSYRNPQNVSDINSTWILISTQSNRFWGTHEVNQNRRDFDNRTQSMVKAEFFQVDLYKKS